MAVVPSIGELRLRHVLDLPDQSIGLSSLSNAFHSPDSQYLAVNMGHSVQVIAAGGGRIYSAVNSLYSGTGLRFGSIMWLSNSRLALCLSDSSTLLAVVAARGLNQIEIRIAPLDSLPQPMSFVQRLVRTSEGDLGYMTGSAIEIWRRRPNPTAQPLLSSGKDLYWGRRGELLHAGPYGEFRAFWFTRNKTVIAWEHPNGLYRYKPNDSERKRLRACPNNIDYVCATEGCEHILVLSGRTLRSFKVLEDMELILVGEAHIPHALEEISAVELPGGVLVVGCGLSHGLFCIEFPARQIQVPIGPKAVLIAKDFHFLSGVGIYMSLGQAEITITLIRPPSVKCSCAQIWVLSNTGKGTLRNDLKPESTRTDVDLLMRATSLPSLKPRFLGLRCDFTLACIAIGIAVSGASAVVLMYLLIHS